MQGPLVVTTVHLVILEVGLSFNASRLDEGCCVNLEAQLLQGGEYGGVV